jgi:hypothetical protein
MSFRDKLRELVTPAPNPLVSKRLVLQNLKGIHELLMDDCPNMARERIGWLIEDINNDKLKPGNL